MASKPTTAQRARRWANRVDMGEIDRSEDDPTLYVTLSDVVALIDATARRVRREMAKPPCPRCEGAGTIAEECEQPLCTAFAHMRPCPRCVGTRRRNRR